MMRVLFTTDAINNVSTQLNAPNYARLNELEGVSIDFYNRNYADYDVVLFMGYDPRVAEARAAKPSLKIGVIDIRPGSLDASMGTDFVIANGLEMQDWLSDYFENIFIYPIYPSITSPKKIHAQHEPLIIGYHGNKVHLMATMPHVATALEILSEHHELELWAVYDIRSLGEMPFELCDPKKVKIRHFQWTDDVYENIISQVDVGIVPNLIPIQEPLSAKRQIAPLSALFNPHDSDILLRFKCTTNPGRIYVFSQLGIPVVAGYSSSAAQAIQHGVNGYLANSAGGWYRALKSLAGSAELREQMGCVLYEDFWQSVSPDILNRRLVNFIAGLQPLSEYPISHFASAEQKLVQITRPKTVQNTVFRYVKKLIKGVD
jgi:glycosyltransferase involved in cell wall biosynthesis